MTIDRNTTNDDKKSNGKTDEQVPGTNNRTTEKRVRRSAALHAPVHSKPTLGYCRFLGVGQNPAAFRVQKDSIAKHCFEKGWAMPTFFFERRSGIDGERPVWQDLVECVRPGTVVVVQEMTRLARTPLIVLTMMRQVQAAGGRIEMANADSNDTMRHLTIVAAAAEQNIAPSLPGCTPTDCTPWPS